jgi:hypothetical protein
MNGKDDQGIPAVLAILVLIALVIGVAKIILAQPNTAAFLTEAPEQFQADYLRAVLQAMWPNPALVSQSLVKLKTSDTLVTWTCSTCVARFKDQALERPAWVTVEDHLQQFCRQFVEENGADPDQLNTRLKQRLGLPLNATYDTFVEFTVSPDDMKKVFRPCADRGTSTTTCDAVAGGDVWSAKPGTDEAIDWLLRNYYSSYATAHPYPWTALGYTFDWARKDASSDEFFRKGESEFVVPAGVVTHLVASFTTARYCEAS